MGMGVWLGLPQHRLWLGGAGRRVLGEEFGQTIIPLPEQDQERRAHGLPLFPLLAGADFLYANPVARSGIRLLELGGDRHDPEPWDGRAYREVVEGAPVEDLLEHRTVAMDAMVGRAPAATAAGVELIDAVGLALPLHAPGRIAQVL